MVHVRAWFGRKLHSPEAREREQLERAARSRPRDGRRWLRLADLLAGEGESRAAVRTYARAAQAFAAQAHEAHAVAVLTTALRLAPADWKLRLRVAELCVRLGWQHRARAELELALDGARSAGEGEAIVRVRELLQQLGAVPGPAGEQSREAAETGRPDEPDEATSGLQDTSRAFRDPDVLEDDDPETLRALAVGFLEMHAFGRALEVIAALLMGPNTRVASLPLAAAAHVGLGQSREAVAALAEAIERSVEADLETAPLWYEQGESLLAAHEPERALSAFREAAAIRPGFRDTGDRIRKLEQVRSDGTRDAS
jgi:tetratricopeptide (TPR) repeat protein